MPKVVEFYLFINDGATRGVHAAQALRERLRCASDTITLGTLAHFRHFRHFFCARL
jgi:hypothetical protein